MSELVAMNMSARANRPMWSRLGWLVLPAIVLVAALFRFSYLEWDGLQLTHPDERYILFVADLMRLPEHVSDLFEPSQSTLNPFREVIGDGAGRVRSYPYGHLPLYTMLAARAAVGELVGSSFPDSLEQLALVGRALSALYDTLLVLVVGLLTKDLFGRWAAWVAAGMAALAVLHIQQAHFATVDSALALYTTLALWFSVRMVQHPARHASLLAGLFAGLAMGSKASGALLIAPLLIVHLLPALRGEARQNAAKFGVAIGTMALAFALTNPYAVLEPDLFLKDVGTQAALVRGRLDWTFVRQYAGTLPVWYFVQQQARWGLGLLLAVAAYAGLGWATFRLWRRKEFKLWPLLIWAWLNLIVVGTQFVKFPRYMLPLTPILFVMAAGMLSRLGRLRMPLAFGILLATGLNAVVFVSLYRQPHPWEVASRWMYDNVPANSSLIVERWDDALPLDMDGRRAAQVFVQQAVDSFREPSSELALARMLREVADSDYVVLSSNRLYGTVGRLDERYPLAAAYYRQLFAGTLGFSLERAFARYPNLLGITIVDDRFARAGVVAPDGFDGELPARRWQRAYADESFTVYDHPLVLIFRNQARLSAADMQAIVLSDT